MYCQNCGNNMGDNSNFCNHCGASAGNNNFAKADISKKEYFASEHCSGTAKNMILANRILLCVLAACLAFTMVTMFRTRDLIYDLLDTEQEDVVAFLEKLEEASGEPLGITEDYIDMLTEIEALTGYSMQESLRALIHLVVMVTIVISAAILIFSLCAVFFKNTGLAIASLVLTVLFLGSVIAIGVTIAILVLTVKLNKEYKERSSFCHIANGNEPYFGA